MRRWSPIAADKNNPLNVESAEVGRWFHSGSQRAAAPFASKTKQDETTMFTKHSKVFESVRKHTLMKRAVGNSSVVACQGWSQAGRPAGDVHRLVGAMHEVKVAKQISSQIHKRSDLGKLAIWSNFPLTNTQRVCVHFFLLLFFDCLRCSD